MALVSNQTQSQIVAKALGSEVQRFNQQELQKGRDAHRKEAGLKIDPETAEISWDKVNYFDPYGERPEISREYYSPVRGYFVCAPGTDDWIWCRDLPEATVAKLANRVSLSLANRVSLSEDDGSFFQWMTSAE
jgi:hypothetical protein